MNLPPQVLDYVAKKKIWVIYHHSREKVNKITALKTKWPKIKIWKFLTFIISVVRGGVVAVIGCTADRILVASGFTLTIERSRILFNCHTGPHYFIVIIVCVVHFFHATGLMIRENLFSAFAFWIQAQIDWACSWIGNFNTSKVSSDAFNLIVVLNWVSQKAKSNFKIVKTFILTHNFFTCFSRTRIDRDLERPNYCQSSEVPTLMKFGNSLVRLNHDSKTRKSLSILILEKQLHQKVMG